jgi:hypothetical protein
MDRAAPARRSLTTNLFAAYALLEFFKKPYLSKLGEHMKRIYLIILASLCFILPRESWSMPITGDPPYSFSFSGIVDWESPKFAERPYMGLQAFGVFSIDNLDLEDPISSIYPYTIHLDSYCTYFDAEAYYLTGEEHYGVENSFSFDDIVNMEISDTGLRIFNANVHEIEIFINWAGQSSIMLAEAGIPHEFGISCANFTPNCPVPEPGSMLLLGMGLISIPFVRRKLNTDS